MATELCERCQVADRVKSERYCKSCRKLVLMEIDDGYLTPRVHQPRYRSGDETENTYETKNGRD